MGLQQPQPKHLVAGSIRLRLEQLVLLAPLWPALAVVTVWAGLALWLNAAVASAAVVAVLLARAGDVGRWVTRCWWRLEWRWAARAGQLLLLAERTVNVTYGADDPAVEVVPALISLRLTTGGRLYVLRPLPTQTLQDFTDACPKLSMRWRVHQCTARLHPDRRGLVVLEVTSAAGVDTGVDRTFLTDDSEE